MKKHIVIWSLVGLILVGCVTAPAQNSIGASTPTPSPMPRKTGTFRYLDLNTPDVRDVPVLMALDTLRGQGYVIELIPLSTTSLLVEAIARGDGELAATNTQNMWAGIAKGANVRTIIQRYDLNTVVVSKQEIKTCQDLNGRSVASSPPAQLNPTLLSVYIERKCPGTKVEFVTISDTSARMLALLSGNVDAAILETQFVSDLERQAPGRYHTLIALAKEFPEVKSGAIHVRHDWAQKNPEIVKDFIRALLTAQRRVMADPALLSEESIKRLALDPKLARETSLLYVSQKLWDVNGGLTQENIRTSLDFFKGIKTVPANLQLDNVADLSYLNAVLDEIGRK